MSVALKLDDLPVGKPTAYADEQLPAEVILVKTGEQASPQVCAWLNICPHQGRPLNYAPNKFLQTPDGLLMCASHGATFDMQTGECVGGPCKGANLRAVPVTVDQAGCIQLSAPEAF